VLEHFFSAHAARHALFILVKSRGQRGTLYATSVSRVILRLSMSQASASLDMGRDSAYRSRRESGDGVAGVSPALSPVGLMMLRAGVI
jgi:hypothetical protein